MERTGFLSCICRRSGKGATGEQNNNPIQYHVSSTALFSDYMETVPLKALTEYTRHDLSGWGANAHSNIIRTKDAVGNVLAGLSGMDDNITLWGGGTYEQAVTAEEGGTPLPVLLTKLGGAGSNIGCLKVIDANTVKVQNGGGV